MKTTFATAGYQYSHGVMPRGDGQWAFCLAEHFKKRNYLDYVKWFEGSYSSAKKRALAAFPKGSRIVVCS